MYICICNAIKQAELRDIARSAEGTAEDLYRLLGHEPMCRQCLEDAEEIVIETRASAKVPACLPH